MKAGEIWWVNFDPTTGSEQAGRRPALIVSGNLLNNKAAVVLVCPITSKIKNYPFDIILKPQYPNGLQRKSEVLAMHLRSVAKDRLESRIGTISKQELAKIRVGIQETLTMD